MITHGLIDMNHKKDSGMEEEKNKSRELYDKMESMMNDPQGKKGIREKVYIKAAQDEIIHIANQQVYGIVDEDVGN